MTALTWKDFTPPRDGRYGAPLGRMSASDLSSERPIHLRKVDLDAGGYDRGGVYWGHGGGMYAARDCEGDVVYLRAASRTDAIRELRETMPAGEVLRFYREA